MCKLESWVGAPGGTYLDPQELTILGFLSTMWGFPKIGDPNKVP